MRCAACVLRNCEAFVGFLNVLHLCWLFFFACSFSPTKSGEFDEYREDLLRKMEEKIAAQEQARMEKDKSAV